MRDKTRKPREKNREPGQALQAGARQEAQGRDALELPLSDEEDGGRPHVAQEPNYSTDPDFEVKLTDVAEPYMSPHENAIVLCVDEKTQIQALERSQPVLPILRNVPERQNMDYIIRRGNFESVPQLIAAIKE